MSISEIFSNEWMKQFKLTTYTAEQVQVAMSDYEAKMNRINEIRTILGKQPEVVDLNWIALFMRSASCAGVSAESATRRLYFSSSNSQRNEYSVGPSTF